MRIKRIEIIGFKSFCDRTVLNFRDPITGVVGPNGCGKSNVVDAIRWCMGEQSAKHLRGQAMADVIFNGSEKRGPAGMAQVSLTFEEIQFNRETLQLALDRDDVLADPVLAAADAEAAGDEAIAPPDQVAPPAPADAVPLEAEHRLEGDVTDVSIEGSPENEPLATIGEAIPSGDGGPLPSDTEAAADAAVDALLNRTPAGAGVAPAMATGPSGEPLPPPPPSATEEVREILTDAPPVIDFSHYSEVTITRRLFRDGSSGYFLNGTPCRLRDITDFFLGTGCGTKAYSIIEQGRIGMIVSARAQDRRYIIEEAAGITKFKTKKKAAERKLDQTRQNLLRVSDIVSELAKRMGSLRRQAQKAERYRRYRSELKDIELWKASHKYLEFRAEEQSLQVALEQASRDLEVARVEFDTRDASIVAERATQAIEERRLAALQEQLYELENRIKLSESKVEYQRREADELEERVASAHAEIETLSARRQEASADLERNSEELAGVDGQVEDAAGMVSEREASFTEARSLLHEGQKLLEHARSQLNAARTELVGAENRREASGRRREDNGRRLGRVREETTGLNERVAELESQARRLDGELATLRQTRIDLGARAEDLENRQLDLQQRVENDEGEVENLRTDLHRKRSRLQSLIEIHDRYEGFARGTRAIMQNRTAASGGDEGSIRGLVADVVDAPAELEVAVEAALGDRLGGILVQSHSVGMQAIRYLKDEAAGRSTFVPVHGPDAEELPAHAAAPGGEGVVGTLTELVRFEDGFDRVGHALLGGTVVVDSLDRALALHVAGTRQSMVTLDGDMVDESGVVCGGSRESEGSSFLGQKREVRELEELTATLDASLADASARLVANKSELVHIARTLEALRGEAHSGELTIRGKEKDLGGAQGELERLRERAARLNSEQLELEEAAASLTQEDENLGIAMEAARSRIDHFEREQLGLLDRVSAGQVQVEELSLTLTEAKVRVAQLGEKRASLEAAVLRGENSCRELGERIAKLEAAIAEDGRRAVELRAEAGRLEEELVTLRTQRTEQALTLTEARNAYESRVSDLEVRDHEVRALRQTAERLNTEVSGFEVKLESLAGNRRHLEETVFERYQLVLRKEVGAYHLRPMVSGDEDKRLVELKRLIERMEGDINLTAIEEFREVSERHDFLASQKQDLENAVGQLERAIFKINKTSRKLFKDTFDAINERFSAMYPRLFRGGRAQLILTGGEEVDLLDAGVEIMAQPPGKKNSTVDQLSGGEKALTAVALLFSIFLIKPSPFCLLDEVDAPLDEANVDRYNEILREMTDRSQFIVITHNKRTMEIVDRLYGVTMEEPGVSKLVSVHLSRLGQEQEVAA